MIDISALDAIMSILIKCMLIKCKPLVSVKKS